MPPTTYSWPKVYILAWLRQRGHNSLSSITSTKHMTSIQNKMQVYDQNQCRIAIIGSSLPQTQNCFMNPGIKHYLSE